MGGAATRAVIQKATSGISAPTIRGPSKVVGSPLSGKPLERWQPLWNLMEALLVHGIDREIWTAEQAWIIECANLDDEGRESRRTGYDMGAAVGAEFASDRPFEIAAAKLFGRSLSVGESCYRHRNENVGRSTRDVLAFPAMALRFHHGFAFSGITQRTAIATAFEFHKILRLSPRILSQIRTSTIPFANANLERGRHSHHSGTLARRDRTAHD